MRTKKLRKIRRARKRKNTYKRKYLKKGRGKNKVVNKTGKPKPNKSRPYCLDILKECTRCFKHFPAKDPARTDNNSLHPSQYIQSAPGFLEAPRIRAARINAEQITDKKTSTSIEERRKWVREKSKEDRRKEKI